MSPISILKGFKEQLVALLDELLEIFPNDGNLYAYRFLISDRLPMVAMMDHFVANVLPFKKLIQNRDEDLFYQGNTIFPSEDEGVLLKIWDSDALEDDDRETIWKYFDFFVELAQRYKEATA